MRLATPEAVEACAGIVRLETTRHIEEAREINQISSPEEVMAILKRGPDRLNFALFRDKFLEHKEKVAPILLRELKDAANDSFVELATDLLHASGDDYSGELIEFIEHGQRDAYIVSVLCVYSGFYDHPKIPKLLWDYYHYLKASFPSETYSDGPLLGLYEIDERQYAQNGLKR